MKGNSIKKGQRCLTLLLVGVMLLPMFVFTAYARSEKQAYLFLFYGAGCKKHQEAIKDDVDNDDSWDTAGLSIQYAEYNGGAIRFYINGPDGTQVTGKTPYTAAYHDYYPIYYFVSKRNTMWNDCTVTLVGEASSAVRSVRGNVQP